MNRVFILFFTTIFIANCSNSIMELKECLTIKQKDENYLITDKKLKSMGFEYAQEYKPALVYTYKFLDRTYYFEFYNPNNNTYLSYILFYEREKNKVDTYATDILVPYLTNNYGKYSETDFDLFTIFTTWNKGIVKAKVWELNDRRVYLIEDFYDKSINTKIDLLFIEIKE